MNITAPSRVFIFSLLIEEQSGCTGDNYAVVAGLRPENGLYDCDVSAWLAPGWSFLTDTSAADVRIHMGDLGLPYTLRLLLSVGWRLEEGRLETHVVTPTLGNQYIYVSFFSLLSRSLSVRGHAHVNIYVKIDFFFFLKKASRVKYIDLDFHSR